jgi:hypothetical protein
MTTSGSTGSSNVKKKCDCSPGSSCPERRSAYEVAVSVNYWLSSDRE